MGCEHELLSIVETYKLQRIFHNISYYWLIYYKRKTLLDGWQNQLINSNEQADDESDGSPRPCVPKLG
jgi:hypothetical protein